MKKITANQNDAGQRLDKFLEKVIPSIPKALLYKSIRKKRVKVNGKRQDISYRITEGDLIELYINDEFFEQGVQEEAYLSIQPNLTITYEDNHLLIVDKPAGMLVHEDNREQFNTLINHIKAYLYQKGEYDSRCENSFVPALCNRIDKNTQGLVICAKNAESLRIINEKIKEREIEKHYLCIAVGHMPKQRDTLKAFLRKQEAENKVYLYDHPIKNGKTIITKYRVLQENDELSLLDVELLTGRTHQIRAHLAYIGHPLLGDGKYGRKEINKKYHMRYQALYSYKLIFHFSGDSGCLSYLNNKEIKAVDAEIKMRLPKKAGQ